LSPPPLRCAIRRYLHYTLDMAVKLAEPDENLPHGSIVLILFEDLTSDSLIRFIAHHPQVQYILLSLGPSQAIHLLSTDPAHKKIAAAISNPKQLFSLLPDSVILEILQKLFHSHGKPSIFKNLNELHYIAYNALSYYKINPPDIEKGEKYITLSTGPWLQFSAQYQKYQYFLNYSKIADHSMHIKELVKTISSFYEQKADDSKRKVHIKEIEIICEAILMLENEFKAMADKLEIMIR
jgi:hypothetical protein